MPNVVAPITLPDGAVNKDVLFDYTTGPTGTNPLSANDHLGGVFPSGRLTIPAGQTAGAITISPNPDTAVETDETGILTVTPVTAGVTIEPPTRVYTFLNDDTAAPSNIYGPQSTADTQMVNTSPANKYTITGTIDNTPWEILFGSATNSGQPGYALRRLDASHVTGYVINADGSDRPSDPVNFKIMPNVTGGVAFSATYEPSTRQLTFIVGGVTVIDGQQLYEGDFFGPYTRFRTGGAARPAITIAAA